MSLAPKIFLVLFGLALVWDLTHGNFVWIMVDIFFILWSVVLWIWSNKLEKGGSNEG